MTVTIRHASADDIAELHALIERCYRGEAAQAGWTNESHLFDGPRTNAGVLAMIIADSEQCMLVAEAEEGLIACVQVSHRGGGLAYLGQLAVDPALQSAGMGRRMIEAAEAQALLHGASTMEMTVLEQRPELIAWYGRRGYAVTGETRPLPAEAGPSKRPLALLVLVKPLSS
jgi:N-acetylglutamate synthase-like GNAT family acetyltransferase